jgi:hypothetical protein
MIARRIGWFASLAAVALMMAAGQARAHTRSQSFSSWEIDRGQVRMTFTVDAREATRLPLIEGDSTDLDTLLMAHLGRRIAVAAGGAPCRRVEGPLPLAAAEGSLRVELTFACSPDKSVELTDDAFFDLAPSHIHYARIHVAGHGPFEALFTDAQRRRTLPISGQAAAARAGATFPRYIELGIEHILTGLDHVAFLIALLLTARRLKEVLFMATGFTLGHSITLSLAVLGVVRPNVPVIEALIGFTIALVAIENISLEAGAAAPIAIVKGAGLAGLAILSRLARSQLPAITLTGLALFAPCYLMLAGSRETDARLRPILTVLFGLIHGFGFASALIELGLPNDRLVPALFGFNIGVEIGQICIVAALWSGASIIARLLPEKNSRPGFELASAALRALGLFWFVSRAFA